jgi:hypothetical protein
MNSTKSQIATILEVEASDIIEIREWVWVYWVHVSGQRPTMVSKKLVKSVPATYTLITYGIRAEFQILPHCAKIAYIDSRKTLYETTTHTIARKRWKTLQSKGFRQAA